MVESERYLDEVGRRLAVADSIRREILEELHQHVEDTVAGLQVEGLEPQIAVRVTLRRLGPARPLARELTTARRGSGPFAGAARHRVRLVGASAAMTLGVIGSVFAMFGGAAGATASHVDLLRTTGTVDNVMAGYIADGIARAQSEGAAAIIIELNTLGGSLSATGDIVSSILEAPLPVIVWVAPAGARAASAGTFITLAGNIALMAPGTNIGAASPVDSNGGDITGTEGAKVRQDAIAKIRAIAETRGRNVAWAVSTVETAKSSPASEAVAVGAVDGIAGSVSDVIAFATGKEVTVKGQKVTLAIADASVTQLDMNVGQSFLHLLSDPNIAFILFALGFYGVLLELIHPNFVTGIIGGLSLILAFIGSGSLPLNVGGVLLLGLAVVLLFLEASVPSHGLLAIGGLICFVLGAATFYTTPGPGLPNVQVAWPVVGVTAGFGLLFALVVLRAAVTSRRMAPALVSTGLGFTGIGTIGRVGEVKRTLDPEGSVYVAGEEWSARSRDGTLIGRGTPVRVVAQDGLILVVEPVEPVEPAESGAPGGASAPAPA